MKFITTDEILDLKDYFLQNPQEAQCKPAGSWFASLCDRIDGQKDIGGYLPWSKTHDKIRIRPGEVSLWSGVNGHGKSLLLGQVIYDLTQQGHKAVVASMEMKPEVTVERMAYQALGFKTPDKQAMLRFINHMTFHTKDGLYIYDQRGTADPETLLAVMRYCAERLKTTDFVIDSLMKCGINSDDYNKQKWFMDNICAIASDTGMHIHMVCHSRKKETEKKIMDKFDIKGSGDLIDMADNIYSVFRNKTKEVEMTKPADKRNEKVVNKPDAILLCDKQRNGEWEGMVSLWHHKDSGQFTGDDSGRILPYGNKILDQQSASEKETDSSADQEILTGVGSSIRRIQF